MVENPDMKPTIASREPSDARTAGGAAADPGRPRPALRFDSKRSRA